MVGTLAPVEGDVIPAGPGWFFEFPVDLCVFTLPGQVPDIVGTGIPIPAPTGTFALVQPLGDNPGEIIGRARDLISSWYPRHSILVTTGGLGRVVLEGAQRRLEAYFAAVTGAFLLLACLTMANLVLYDVVRNWRALGIRRAVGASRVQVWSGLVGGAVALQSTMTAGVSIDGDSPPITASAYVVDGAFLEVRGFDLEGAFGAAGSASGASSAGTTGSPTAYLGHDLARALFGGDMQSAWEQALFVDGQAFRVVGVLVDRPAAAVDPVLDRDWSVILRLADAKDLPSYAVGATRPEVWLVPPEGVTAEEAAQGVTALVAAEEGLVVRPLIEEVATLRRARQATNLAFLILAAGGLALGGLGVSAFFFSHTVEQAREDAIRRSVGATKRHVFVRVVRQAAILGLEWVSSFRASKNVQSPARRSVEVDPLQSPVPAAVSPFHPPPGPWRAGS